MLDRSGATLGRPAGVRAAPMPEAVLTTADVRSFLRLRRKSIIVPIVLALLAAGVYVETATPTYNARAEIVIDPRIPQILPGRTDESVLAWDTAQVESEIAVLQSERIASIVIRKLRLDKADDFHFTPSLKTRLMAWLSGAQPKPMTANERFRAALDLIADGLVVHRAGLSYAIDIGYSSPDPVRAAEIANATADAYITDQLESRSETARLGGEWLQQRMAQLAEQMNHATEAVQIFRASHNYGIARSDPTGDAAAAHPSTPQAEGKTLDELEAAANTYRRIYESFLQAYTESVQRQSFPVSDAHVLTPASLPLVKSFPRPLLSFALAGLVGAMAGFGLALLRHRLDQGIRSPRDLRDRLELEFLGNIPLFQTRPRWAFWRRSKPSDRLTAVLDPRQTALREAITTVKTLVDVTRRDRPTHRIGVVSPEQGEGKTTLAGNLALAFAEAGSKVLLVDGDLREQASGHPLAPNARAGLRDILAGRAVLDDCLATVSGSSAQILPAGGGRPRKDGWPGWRLAADFIHHQLGHGFDLVIVDLPPVLPVADTVALAPLLDGVLLVAAWGETTLGAATDATALLERAQARILGFVINKVRA